MNEVYAIVFTVAYLCVALWFYRMGKTWLQAYLATSYILTLILAPKFFDFFGLTASMGSVAYAGIFFATDMLTERYGKATGYQTVRVGFALTLLFVAMTQINILFEPVAFSASLSDAQNIVFGSSLRLMVAGFCVYLFAQHFDVWLYHKLHEKTGAKHLWLRNCGSTLISQFLDSVLFFTLAFYGTMSNDILLNVMLTGFLIKSLIAFLDTPFMYLARRMTPLDLKKN